MTDKMKIQLQALICLSVSIWGLSLIQAWMMYGMVIQPAMIYEAIQWPDISPGARMNSIKDLMKS